MKHSNLDKIVWGAPSFWIERFPLYCGHHLGFFRQQGVEIEIWYSYGGPELARAVQAGDIHIGEMGLPPFVTAYTRGLPARIIGSSTIQQLESPWVIANQQFRPAALRIFHPGCGQLRSDFQLGEPQAGAANRVPPFPTPEQFSGRTRHHGRQQRTGIVMPSGHPNCVGGIYVGIRYILWVLSKLDVTSF